MPDERLGPPPLDREVLWEVVSWGLGIAAFAAAFWATEWIREANRPQAMFSVAFGILTYLAAGELLRIRRFRQIDRVLEALKRSQDRLVEHERVEHELVKTLHNLLDADAVLRDTGFDALKRVFVGLTIERDEPFITVSGADLTFASYQFFWTRMVNLQKDLHTHRQPRRRPVHMVARLTHSGSVTAWSTSDILVEIKRLHGQFTEAGGEVFRIFLDDGSTGALPHYIKAMREMLLAGVRCAYMRAHPDTDIRAGDFKRDFCIIDPQRYSSDWVNSQEHEVTKCEIGRRASRYQHNDVAWDRLQKELRRYDYGALGLTARQTEFFECCRESFFQKGSSPPEVLVAAADRCLSVIGHESA